MRILLRSILMLLISGNLRISVFFELAGQCPRLQPGDRPAPNYHKLLMTCGVEIASLLVTYLSIYFSAKLPSFIHPCSKANKSSQISLCQSGTMRVSIEEVL